MSFLCQKGREVVRHAREEIIRLKNKEERRPDGELKTKDQERLDAALRVTRRDMIEKSLAGFAAVAAAGFGALKLTRGEVTPESIRSDFAAKYTKESGPELIEGVRPKSGLHKIQDPGTFEVFFDDSISVGERAIYMDNVRKVFPYILRDEEIRRELNNTRVELFPVSDLAATMELIQHDPSMRNVLGEVLGDKPLDKSFNRSKTGDAFTMAFVAEEPITISKFMILITSEVMGNPARLLATLDHEAGHVLKTLQGYVSLSRPEAEVMAYREGMKRLSTLGKEFIKSSDDFERKTGRELLDAIIPEQGRRLSTWERASDR